MSYGTISDIEILWCLVAIVGALFSIYNLFEANRDMKALEILKITNGRRAIAKAARFQDVVRAAVHLIFFTIGVLAAFLPETSPPTRETPLVNILIGASVRWGLIIASVLLMTQSYIALRLRRDLLEQEVDRIEATYEDELQAAQERFRLKKK